MDTVASVAVTVGWAVNLELLLVIVLLPMLPFRVRRLIGYAIGALTLASLWQWKQHDPSWDLETILGQTLLVNLAIMYALKGWLIGRRSPLGRAISVNNLTLTAFFLAAQAWLLWDGGVDELRIHLIAYIIVLITVNHVIDVLLEPGAREIDSPNR